MIYILITIVIFLSQRISSAEDLKLIHPNGGEVIVAGSNPVIVWEGVVPSDTIVIDFSTNSGKSWRNITNSGTQLKHIWENTPLTASSQCLLRVSKGNNLDESGEYNNPAPKKVWEKTYARSPDYRAKTFIKCSDGNFIIIGEAYMKGGHYDIPIIKFNSINGNIIWEQIYGGNRNEFPNSIKECSDGSIVVVASTKSSNGDVGSNIQSGDIWIFKLKSDDGSIIWSKTFGGNSYEVVKSLIEASDGNFVVAVQSDSNDGDISENKGEDDIWLFKINSIDGSIMWQKNYGGSRNEIPFQIIETTDGSYTVAGAAYSSDKDINENKGEYDVWLLQVSPTDGSIIWEKTYGGSRNEEPSRIIESSDGNYIVIGSTESVDGDISESRGSIDIWVFKINSRNGSIIWEKSFGGSNYEGLKSIIESLDNNLVLCIYTLSKDGDIIENDELGNLWIIKLNPIDGSVIWQRTYYNLGYIGIVSFIENTEGNYIVEYIIENLHYLLKVDQYDGKKIWEKDYFSYHHSGTSNVLESTPGQYVLIGHKLNGKQTTSGDLIIIKLIEAEVLQSDTSDEVFSIVESTSSIIVREKSNDLIIFTNMSNNSVNVTLNIRESGVTNLALFDNQGIIVKKLLSDYETIGVKEINLDLSNYPNGRYYIKLTTPTITKTEIIEVVR